MKIRKNITMLFAIPVLMFGFGYLMVPIYDIFCELTGLNGKTGSITIQRVSKMQVDESRLVKVEFMANRNRDIPMEFMPVARSMRVHPGKPYQAAYRARNLKAAAIIGQAVPSVSPSKASTYFNKTECFCFGRQDFAAGEERELPLVFVIHPDLPKDIETITLSYTFFEVEADDAEQQDEHEHDHDHSTHDHNRITDAVPAPKSAGIAL